MRAAALPLALALLLAPAAAHGRGHRCSEVAHPVVGRAVCSRFGRWDDTRPIVDIAGASGVGGEWHRLLLAPRTFQGSLTLHQKYSSFPVAGAQLGARSLDVGTGRLGMEVFRVGPVHLGPTFEFGGGAPAGAPSFQLRGATYALTSSTYASVGVSASAGVRLGPLTLRGELFGGPQGLTVFTDTQPPTRRVPRLATPTGGGSSQPVDGLVLYDTRFRLAPRVAVEAWPSEYVAVGIGGGMDVIHRDDFSMGAYLRSYFDKRGEHDPRTP